MSKKKPRKKAEVPGMPGFPEERIGEDSNLEAPALIPAPKGE